MAQTKNRNGLHEILCDIMRTYSLLDSENCYFSPPSTKRMKYPCIVYELSGIRSDFADNLSYRSAKRYTVTVIDENPDSEIPNQILNLPHCVFDRAFPSDGLNHFVFTLYY